VSGVLVTGGSGFAGGHLVAACRAAGDEVVTAERATGVDLLDAGSARAAVAAAGPDVVYHLAARAHVGESWKAPAETLRDNVAMTVNLLEAVRAEAPEATVVAVSSSEVYGPPARLPVDESALLRPQNPYALSKASSDLAAGFYADAHGLRVVRARAFNHSGRPRWPPRRASRCCGSSPAIPTRAATTPTCATSCGRTGCSRSTPSPACSTSARACRVRRAS
jgi:GDP-4-dehydro-6-deoxy-D-mannose reductase